MLYVCHVIKNNNMKHFALRIVNDDNYDKIVAMSKQEQRSVNNQINVMLDRDLKRQEDVK